MKHKILLIEDDESFYQAVKLMMSSHPVDITWADSGAKGIQLFRDGLQKYSTVIIDYLLPDHRGTEICQTLRRLNPEQDFLFTSGHEKLEYIMDVATTGSSGFLFKGRPIQELRDKILQSLATFENKNRVLGLDDYEPTKAELDLKSAGFIGRSQALYKMLGEIETAKNSDYPTLIVGETGTGKELVARALTPKGKNLIAVNCASFIERENFLESDLFGYVKGAFTGADRETTGLVTQAQGQVLFLDELHQLPIAAQAKLLRFLQEMKFRKVGDSSAKETSANFKLIAAVQSDIKDRLKDGRFLPDLIERVGALQIRVPSLKERPEDIEPLARSIQDNFNSGRTPLERKQIRISTVCEMEKQSWPTNVRGLQNAVKQMLTNCKSDIVNPKDFAAVMDKNLMVENSAPNRCDLPLDEATKNFEKQKIEEVLNISRTQAEAATRLGVPFSSFSRKIAKLGINPERHLKLSTQ